MVPLQDVTMAVVGGAFGQPPEIWANKRISEVCSDIIESHAGNGVVLTQADIIPRKGIRVVRIPGEEPGKAPPTLRIARFVAQFVKNHPKIKTVWVVAAWYHMPRMLRDVKWAFAELGITDVLILPAKGRVGIWPRRKWFCKDSTQSRTTGDLQWWIREIPLLMMTVFPPLYKKVAS